MKTKKQHSESDPYIMAFVVFIIILFSMVVFFSSCSAIDRLESDHYSFYAQKAFFCTGFEKDRAKFVNASGTKNYICKSKFLSQYWNEGDTLIVDEYNEYDINYNTFWSLKKVK